MCPKRMIIESIRLTSSGVRFPLSKILPIMRLGVLAKQKILFSAAKSFQLLNFLDKQELAEKEV